MKRLGMIIAVGMCLALPSDAWAGHTEWDYWGFNNLSSTNPSGQCLDYVGRACTGFNNWYYSGVEKLSGDDIRVGFMGSTTPTPHWWVQMDSSWNDPIEPYNLYWWSRDYLGAAGYNRAYCKYQLGEKSYTRCWRDLG